MLRFESLTPRLKPSKILNAKGLKFSTSTRVSTSEVLKSNALGTRYMILNRPKVYNSLNRPMLDEITKNLQEWSKSELVNNIIIKANSNKFYCAGGDVVWAAKNNTDPATMEFFKKEYQTNHLLSSMTKPVIALMNGITMGGGVGISVHAPFRVATENTMLAMPETKIGFYTDVGGSFILSRLDENLGTYLALTGARVKGIDAFYAGFATHYVPSERLPILEQRLQELPNDNMDVVNSAIEEFVEESSFGKSEYQHRYSLAPVLNSIKECFKFKTMEEIIEALNNEKDNVEWAKETLALLAKMSPTSLKVNLELLHLAKNLSMKDCMNMESQLTNKMLHNHDFVEGVFELLVRKSNAPKWSPATLPEVSLDQIRTQYFLNPVKEVALEFYNDIDFMVHPYSKYTLPSEQKIRAVVTGEDPDAGDNAFSKEELINYFAKLYSDKVGVREKVSDVINRNTIKNPHDDVGISTLSWNY